MRLAHARHADQQQPAVASLSARKGIDHALREHHAALQRVVVRLEVRQRAVLVAAGNIGGSEPLLPGVGSPAFAAFDPAHAMGLDGFPAGVIAERTGHVKRSRGPSVEVRPEPFRAPQFFLRTRFDLPDTLA